VDGRLAGCADDAAPAAHHALPGVPKDLLDLGGTPTRLSAATPEQAAWKDAPFLEPLDEAGVAEAIAAGFAPTPDLEMELRVLRWWRGNDPFRRDDAPVGHTTDPDAIANIQRIIEMMKDGEEDLLLFRAEAQRELGLFEEAERTLDGVCCSDWWPAKSRLLGLIHSGSRKLDVLFSPIESGEAAGET
jgi:hypothetical protein